MIKYKKNPWKSEEVKKILNPVVRSWFFSKFNNFSLPQLYGVMEIHSRNNILISAPTGATKTLTGFLSILNELIDSESKGILEDKIYAVYVSPLKALNEDIKHNLLTPLKEMEELSGKKINLRVAVRTGDTTSSEKQKMLKKPPHILITTPESLAILLSSIKFREHLKNVEWCIIDEIHALAENKRGVHLSLSLERLERLSGHMTRVGLSATVSPLEKIAKYLVGFNTLEEQNKTNIKTLKESAKQNQNNTNNEKNHTGKLRPCKIVDVQFIKEMDLKVLSPVKDIINTDYNTMQDKLYSLMDRLIQKHKTTLIFTNTRAATERIVHNLKERFPQKYTEYSQTTDEKKAIGAHHGSLSKEHRHNLEKRLREGKIKAAATSTSLELGIDIGYIDLVICLGSPKSVARTLQRIGRSGHKLTDITKGRIIVMDRDDLVECSVLLKSAIEKKIDRIHIPTNCLDVLAQQIFGIAIEEKIHIDELFSLIKNSYCYNTLKRKDFLEVINYLAGLYSELEDRHIYAKIWYDSETGMIGRKGKLARVLYMTNIGTIPDQTGVTVKVGEHILGTIDEAFLEKLRPGDLFVLGGNVYRFKYSRGMTTQVSASVNSPPTVPSWFSEMLPLSFDLADEIGRFRKLISDKFSSKKSKQEIIKFIHDYVYVDDNSAEAIYNYFFEQFNFSIIPSNKKILIESYTEEIGGIKKRYTVFHALYGRRVNDCLSRAVAFVIAKLEHRDCEIGINDNGFFIASNKPINPIRALKKLNSKDFRKILNQAVDSSEVIKRRFRHCAARALMILRNYKGKKKYAGRQQVSSSILINAVKRIDSDFFIIKETRREVLEDLMDIKNAEKIIKGIENKSIQLKEENTLMPSPFSFGLVSQGIVDIMKIEDRIEFIKRMHMNVLAKISLKKRNKKIKPEEFSYIKEWDKEEKETIEQKNWKIEELREEALNLKIPAYHKRELLKLISGDEDIRQDLINNIHKDKEKIEKSWPKKIRKFVFEKIL